MRFLADENCDQRLLEALRSAGHDVLSMRDLAAGSDDDEVLSHALGGTRVLLTEDKGFGELVHRQSLQSPGVILFRVPLAARDWLVRNAVAILKEYELTN